MYVVQRTERRNFALVLSPRRKSNVGGSGATHDFGNVETEPKIKSSKTSQSWPVIIRKSHVGDKPTQMIWAT